MLLALVLGAAHAALPGHGKTVMAAYLAGRAGRPRDAVAVGATVTFTHTGGVLALGLLLTTFAGIAGESVLGWLGVASGTLVAAIGVGALASALRRRNRDRRAAANRGVSFCCSACASCPTRRCRSCSRAPASIRGAGFSRTPAPCRSGCARSAFGWR